MSRGGGAFAGSLVFGWFIVAFFLVGGIAFTVVIPEIWIGQIWIVVALVLGAVFFLIGRNQAGQAKLKREGIRGTARILGGEQTGVYVNEQPQMRFKLRVEAPGVTPFETEKKAVVPFLAIATLGSGRRLTVYLDRANHQELAIDWDDWVATAAAAPDVAPVPTPVADVLRTDGVEAAHAAAAADPATPVKPPDSATTLSRFQKLMELKNAQLITDEEFAEHRARILGEI